MRTYKQFRFEMEKQFPDCQFIEEREEDGLFYAAIRVNERPLYFDFDRGYIITVSSCPSSEWFSIRTRKTQHAGYGYLRGVYIFA